MRRIIWLPLVFLLAAALILVGCPTPPETTTPPPGTTTPPPETTTPPLPKTLKIGLISSVTGMMAPAFKSEIDAAEPTQEFMNQRGGITVNGQQYNIEIITEDDLSSPDGAVAAANILMQAGVKFMLPPMFQPNCIAIGPICEEGKILRVSLMVSDPTQFGPGNPYHFSALFTVFEIGPTYDYLLKNYPQVKKIAIMPPDDPGAIFAQDFTVKEAEKHGLEVVFNEAYLPGTQDFYPIVTKALANKPDAIDGIFSTVPWGAAIINSSRELGFTGPIMCGCGFGDINQLNSMLKPQYAYDIFHGSPDVLSDKMLPIVKELRPMVEQKTGAPLNMDNVNVLAGLMIMLQGIEKAQSFDTDKVVAALESMKSVDTPWGEGIWSGEELGGINHMMMIVSPPLSKVANGKVEFEFLKR